MQRVSERTARCYGAAWPTTKFLASTVGATPVHLNVFSHARKLAADIEEGEGAVHKYVCKEVNKCEYTQ